MAATVSVAAFAEEGYDPAFLELEKSLGGRRWLEGSLPEKRAQFNGLMAMLAQGWPPVDGLEVFGETTAPTSSKTPILTTQSGNNTETETAVADEEPTVPLRIYRPSSTAAAAAAAASTQEKLPVAIWYHGGGWMAGNLDSEDPQCRLVAKQTPCVVVSVDYRRLPENRFSSVMDDCTRAFDWALEHAAELGGDPGRVFAFGGSCGAALALGVVHRLVKAGRRTEVAGCVAVYPVAVHALQLPDKYAHLHTSFKELEMTAAIVRGPDQLQVLEASGVGEESELVAVQFTYDDETLAQFPPVYIATAGKDLLRDDGVVLEAALQDAGGHVKRDHYMGLPHYFWAFPQLQKSKLFVDNVVGGIKWITERDGQGGVVVHGI